MMWSWELGRFFQSYGLRLRGVGSSSGGTGHIIVVENYNGRDLMISNGGSRAGSGVGGGACSLFVGP